MKERRAWFDRYVDQVETGELPMPPRGLRYPCACCGYPTLQGMPYEVCVLCWWENNGQDDPYADEVWEGTNHGYALSRARANFADRLSMFDPERDVCTDAEREAKRRMVEGFEQLRTAAPEEREALWRALDRQERTLDAAFNRTLRALERKKKP